MARTVKFYAGSTGDGSPLVLCDTPDVFSGPYGLDGEQQVDVQTAVRRNFATPVPRGNASHQISFEVKYAPKATPAEAEDAAGDLVAAIVAASLVKNLVVIQRDTSALHLTSAVIPKYRVEARGVTVIGRFTVICGAVTRVT